jgi:hypothetical protein
MTGDFTGVAITPLSFTSGLGVTFWMHGGQPPVRKMPRSIAGFPTKVGSTFSVTPTGPGEVLSLVSAPEPGVYGLLAMGILALFAGAKRIKILR